MMLWEASRAPAGPSSTLEHPSEQSQAKSRGYPPRSKGEDYPVLFALEEVDERGYVSTRKLHMGCEAAVCRTAFGARIVAGRGSLNQPQYAWDYAGVRLAEEALVHAEFKTHSSTGIVGVEDFGRGRYRAAEPQNYVRRWRYTPEGQMEGF